MVGMKKLVIISFLLSFESFAIDPTPGTGFYELGLGECNSCASSDSLQSIANAIKSVKKSQ